ncbi:MAG: hypothetical protein F8N37_25355, partial [Telmatospirillum sp.]|nr:hypothetical protein [Telmatospirillum sp.]
MVRNFRINVDGHVYSVSVEELAADVHDARPGANVAAPPPPHHAAPQPPPAPDSACACRRIPSASTARAFRV